MGSVSTDDDGPAEDTRTTMRPRSLSTGPPLVDSNLKPLDRSSTTKVDRMGVRRKLYELLGGDSETPPVTSTEPTEIGYVPLWQSQILVTRLGEEGFHAHAIDDVRVGPLGRIPLQPMSTIHVPAREAAAARARLDELSTI